MISFLFFILFLLLENLFLPALIGPRTFLISPLFLAGLVIYSKSFKAGAVQALIFLLIWEVFSGFQIGSLMMPFAVIIGLFIWLNRFLNISSGLKEMGIVPGTIGGVLTMTLFVYSYSWLFLFFNLSFDPASATQELVVLVANSWISTISWSVVFVILFKYVLRPK